jgi:DNA-binding NtrC family response regulator
MSTTHTLLLVDDEPEILESLRRALRNEGYRILVANDAERALAHLEREPIDVLVADIDMPGMTGLELVTHARRAWPGTVRMLLTGDASLDSALHAINEGEVHRYLTKPWSNAELRATLRQALARLDELRRAAAADRATVSRDALLAELERAHAGIRTVPLDEGAYLVDAERVVALLPADPEVRQLVEPELAPTREPTTWHPKR